MLTCPVISNASPSGIIRVTALQCLRETAKEFIKSYEYYNFPQADISNVRMSKD